MILKKKIEVIKHFKNGRDYTYTKRPYKEQGKCYQPEIFDQDNVCIVGYWQNPLYFIDIIDVIRKSIVFPEYCMHSIYRDDIIGRESVSIHIRLTDYCQNEGFANICNENYYFKAIDKVNECVVDPVFFVFSDDIETARQILGSIGKNSYNKILFIDSMSSVVDLYLMTLCKHHVIANSTYSWWGACLGEHNNGIVISPKIWSSKYPDWNMSISSWIQI